MVCIKKGAVTLGIAIAGRAIFAQVPVGVTVNGDPVDFASTQPMRSNGRVMVPLRGVFEKMGATVKWDQGTNSIDATRSSTHVHLKIGNRIATVNGKRTMLEAPPEVVRGSTMVPLRFVSEALGGKVTWHEDQQVAEIITSGQTVQTRGGDSQGRTFLTSLTTNSVIPVTLTSDLSSDQSRDNDKFTAQVRTSGADAYGGIPAGSTVEGHVVMAKAKDGNHPGLLQLAFDRIVFPDGSTQPIDGTVVGLDPKSVTKNADGILTAKQGAATKDPLVYVGYGAGAGALIALITKGNVVTDTVVGGALGYLLNTLEKKNTNPKDVALTSGTALGVRLTRSIGA